MVKIILIQILLVLSGYLYCIGGRDKDNTLEINKYWFLRILPKWMFKGSVRDIGCSLCSIGAYFLIAPSFSWWKLGLFIALQFWACRSYFQWVNNLLLKLFCIKCIDKDCNFCYLKTYLKNKQWWNWFLVGLVSSAKWLLVDNINCLLMVIIRAVIVSYVSEKENDAVKEEFYRGTLIL